MTLHSFYSSSSSSDSSSDSSSSSDEGGEVKNKKKEAAIVEKSVESVGHATDVNVKNGQNVSGNSTLEFSIFDEDRSSGDSYNIEDCIHSGTIIRIHRGL